MPYCWPLRAFVRVSGRQLHERGVESQCAGRQGESIIEVGAQIRDLTGAINQRPGATRAGKIIPGVVGADGWYHYGLPVVLVETLHTQQRGDVHRAPDHPLGNQHILRAGGGLQSRHQVERIDDVDAIANEVGFSPVEHLIADTNVEGRTSRSPANTHVQLTQVGVLTHAVACVLGQRRTLRAVVFHFEVVERTAPGEHADTAGRQCQLAVDADHVGDQTGFEVQVAVVDVGVDPGAAVGSGNDARITILQANGHAVGHGDVENAFDVVVLETAGAERAGRQGDDHQNRAIHGVRVACGRRR